MLAECCLVFLKFDQEDFAAKVAQHILPQIASYLFRTLIPETDPALPVHKADAGLQAFQCSAEDFDVLKVQHLQPSQGSYRRKSSFHEQACAGQTPAIFASQSLLPRSLLTPLECVRFPISQHPFIADGRT